MKAIRVNALRLLLAMMACAILVVGCSDDGDNGGSGPTGPGGGEDRPHFKTVSIQGNTFIPASLIIAVGDTVRWTNNDNVQHTVTSDTGDELASSLLSDGQTYQNVFQSAGSFPYHCTVHPAMQGSVTVQ